MTLSYRPEIDGLRCVAVLPVIAYHAGFPGFPGGFVGVDVFFVISGYLITGILAGDLAQGRFSIGRFYERRARRILPALFAMLAVSVILALAILIPPLFRDFSESLLAVVLFVSNMLFVAEIDYFAPAAENTVLLHTWSLAVEEQFYILFPLILWGLWRVGGRSALFWGVAVTTAASFAFSEYAWREISAAQSFYVLPSRAWELGAGALCALAAPATRPLPAALRHGLGLAGLAAIALAVALLDRSYPFPSYWALLPVGGTVAIILWATPGSPAARLLSLRPVVAIGLVSYSAYLWHHPLFAFARIRSEAEPGPAVMTALAALSLVLAALSWRLVEEPFRKRQGGARLLPRRAQVFGASLAGIATFGAIAVWGYASDGRAALWLAGASDMQRRSFALVRAVEDTPHHIDDGACRFNRPGFGPETPARLQDCAARHGPGLAVIGDSHAIDLADALIGARIAPFVFGMTQGGCRPDTPDAATGADPECGYGAFLALLDAHPGLFAHVVLETAGQHMIEGPGGREAERLFVYYAPEAPMPAADIRLHDDRLAAIAAYAAALARRVPVRWLTPRIEPHLDAAHVLAQGCDHAFALRPGQAAVFERLAAAIAGHAGAAPDLHVLDQPALLDFAMPRDFATCDALHWIDGDHLSLSGRAWLAERLGPALWP